MPAPANNFLLLYRHMLTARRVDEMERQATNRGIAYFHISGVGHEASAALAFSLGQQDWLHCHYRDKALMIARGLTASDFFLSLLAKQDSPSRGRQMNCFMAAREHHVLSMAAPVGNQALQAAGLAAAVKETTGSPIVLASMGDGTTQQGEVLEAIAEAARSNLPVLFLVHDNGLAISTRTSRRTFYSLADGSQAENFIGIPITRLDGRNPHDCIAKFSSVVSQMRDDRKPAVVILECERMGDHSNADDHRVYRDDHELELWKHADPIANLHAFLLSSGAAGADELAALDFEVTESVQRAFADALASPEPQACLYTETTPDEISRSTVRWPAGAIASGNASGEITMLEALRETLRQFLQHDPGGFLYGEDIDDPKGDVFGLTRGLGSSFPGRVVNSPLSESTIVGTCIGRALAGQRPVAFIQFADFLSLAWNQISQELATMAWRTAGEFEAPVVIMAPAGGYKGGLGPFHAQTNDSLAAHIPGLDVFVPGNAIDAAALLRYALQSSRPTIFLYPKLFLNDRLTLNPETVESELASIVPGKARWLSRGDDITVVTWGSTLAPVREAVNHATAAGLHIDLIDLRTLAPWDKAGVIESVNRTGALVVVHEDNLTGGFGAEIVASATEHTSRPIRCRRIARADTHVPFHLENQLEVLPDARRILAAIAELTGAELVEQEAAHVDLDPFTQVVNAFGTSPSDDRIRVLQWHVNVGDNVLAGQLIADVETDKASGEIDAPTSGSVTQLLARPGETVRVGQPLLHIKTDKHVERELVSSLPSLVLRNKRDSEHTNAGNAASVPIVAPGELPSRTVQLSRPTVALGSDKVTNEQLGRQFPQFGQARIFEKTGITSRPKVAPGETPVTLALAAASQAMASDPSLVDRLELIVCATSSVERVSPSIACSVLIEIRKHHPACHAQAYDILATCSGYLYGVQIAYDFLAQRPGASVLLLTSEVLSPLVHPEDFGSCISFGDAATATWCTADPGKSLHPAVMMERPLCFASGDKDTLLTVPPLATGETIRMDGGAVRQLTVPAMSRALRRAAQQAGIQVNELSRIIPHQTNRRIINDLAEELGVEADRMFINLECLGNTSSCTLPIAIRDYLVTAPPAGQKIGFVTFGGGFTYAAAVGHLP